MGKKLIENKKDKIFVTSLGLLGAVLLILITVFIFVKIENNKYIEEITIEKESLQTELTGLSADFKNLQTDNDSLKVKLVDEQEKITLIVEKMRVFRNNSYAEISKYKKQVNGLRTILRSYVVQIDSLNRLNKALTAENKQVKKQMIWAEDRAKKLKKEKEKMAEQLTVAATLEAIDFTLFPVNKRGRKIKKIRKATKLKAVFSIQKNVTAKRGVRKLYLRITRPDESLLFSPDKAKFKYQGTKLYYSATREIEYEGELLEVALFWKNDKSLVKGIYKADLFSEKDLIGSTTFKLK
jgi:FtsZ-binding cell division protein ZapB